MIWLYLIIFIILFVAFVPFRIAIFHPFKTLFYSIYDFILYIFHFGWRSMETGKLTAYCAEFGGGKTLSMAHWLVRIYQKYNNKRVWDRSRKKFVLQKIHIISNFELLSIPFEPLRSLSQAVACAQHNKDIDTKNGTLTVTIIAIDEASVQLNSRNFKTNIDPLFLNTLLTCRHYHMNLIYSSQSFKLTDALLRSVTRTVIQCRKLWRFCLTYYYSAEDLEYASDPTLVKPYRRTGYFVRNKDYSSYDTLATVDNLKKSVYEGDMLSEDEIIALRGNMNPDNDSVTHRSFRLKRRKR